MIETRDRRRRRNGPSVRHGIVDLRLEDFSTALGIDDLGVDARLACNPAAHGEDGPIRKQHGVDVHPLVVEPCASLVNGLCGSAVHYSDPARRLSSLGGVVLRAATEDHESVSLRWRQDDTGGLVALARICQAINHRGCCGMHGIEKERHGISDRVHLAARVNQTAVGQRKQVRI